MAYNNYTQQRQEHVFSNSHIGGSYTRKYEYTDNNRRDNDTLDVAQKGVDLYENQLNSWTDLFGDIQENLSEYYKNLSPEKYAVRGLQQQQIGHQKSQDQIKNNLALRGLGGGKFEAYLLAQSDVQNNITKNTIRNTAEDKVAQQKLGFLNIGLQQKGRIDQGLSNAYANQGNTLAHQSDVFKQGARADALNASNQRITSLNNQALEKRQQNKIDANLASREEARYDAQEGQPDPRYNYLKK